MNEYRAQYVARLRVGARTVLELPGPFSVPTRIHIEKSVLSDPSPSQLQYLTVLDRGHESAVAVLRTKCQYRSGERHHGHCLQSCGKRSRPHL